MVANAHSTGGPTQTHPHTHTHGHVELKHTLRQLFQASDGPRRFKRAVNYPLHSMAVNVEFLHARPVDHGAGGFQQHSTIAAFCQELTMRSMSRRKGDCVRRSLRCRNARQRKRRSHQYSAARYFTADRFRFSPPRNTARNFRDKAGSAVPRNDSWQQTSRLKRPCPATQ